MSVISGWVSYKTGPRREALQRDISECLDLKVRNSYLAIQRTICSYETRLFALPPPLCRTKCRRQNCV